MFRHDLQHIGWLANQFSASVIYPLLLQDRAGNESLRIRKVFYYKIRNSP